MNRTKISGPSVLELQLKQVIRDHPHTTIHPHSPSGPHSRTVMWLARGGLVKGQVFWEPAEGRWVVRAKPTLNDDHVITVHPGTEDDIPSAITEVLAQL